MSIFEEESTEPLEKQAWRIADNSSCGDNLTLIYNIAKALADAAAPRLGLIEQNHHFAAQIEGFTRENEGLRKERDKLVRILKIVEQYISGPPPFAAAWNQRTPAPVDTAAQIALLETQQNVNITVPLVLLAKELRTLHTNVCPLCLTYHSCKEFNRLEDIILTSEASEKESDGSNGA